MKFQRLCLGYDLRLPIQSSSWVAPPHLDSQCLAPRGFQLSADPNVWPSTTEVSELICDQIGTLANPLCLASDIDLLIKTCKDKGINTDEMLAVAFTCLEENFIPLNERYGGPGWFKSSKSEDDMRNFGWEFVGFDILDLNGLISGLSGCEYKPESKQKLYANFANALNDLGLFNSNILALRFANVRGLQIPQHAPFTPVGVWIKRRMHLASVPDRRANSTQKDADK